MALTNHNLRALFPTHFSRRGETGEAARNWRTLRLPNVRVVGPFWSFVMKAAAMEVADGETPAVQLATLAEVERAVATPKGLDAFHTPTAYRARLDGIWSTNETKFQTTSPDTLNSRISALAVALVDGPELLLPAPISNTGGFDPALSTEVLLRPLGDLPVQSASNSPERDLTAMQLASGQLWFSPQPDYLEKLRAILSLEAPDAVPYQDRIALLPDGFALAGRVHLPWDMDTPLDAWFKLTTGPQGTPLPGQLRLWFGPDDTGEIAQAARGLLQTFERVLVGTGSGRGPGWLDLGANRALRPEDLFWPCQTSGDLILQERPSQDHEVHIDSDALVLRLSPDARRSGTSQMVLNPPGFAVSRPKDKDVPVLTATEGTKQDDASVIYRFDPSEPDQHLRETVHFSDKTTLAVPVLDTAARLADQTNISAPGGAKTGLLWLFTPLTNGWLHWPFPFATSANSAAVVAIGEGPEASPAEAQDGAGADTPEAAKVVGRFQLANQPGGDGFDRYQREWSIALSDPLAYRVTAILDADGDGGITWAEVTLAQPIIAIDGLLPLTVFRQSDTRLLPERADRALRPAALNAVTERGLSGIEQQARGAVSVTATVRNLSISRQADGRAVTSPEAGLTLATQLEAEAWQSHRPKLLPWAWLRHDRIATIQSLPLAVTGTALDQPSGSRELTPLVASNPRTTLAFSGAFNMMRPDVTYQTEARFERPTAALPWQDEIGMIPSTLTSLTLFAGHGFASTKPVGPTLEPRWGGMKLADAGLQAELRLDVPASDPAHAMTALPPPPPPAPEEEEADGAATPDKTAEPPFLPPLTFDPQPDNGPGETKGASSWRTVFQDRNRSLILAALDRRVWVRPDGPDKWVMDNLLGDVSKSVDTPEIDLSLGLEGDTVLTHAGRITVDDTDYRGLPATSDMQGVSAHFNRPPSNGTEVKNQITRSALDDPMDGASTTPHRDQMGFEAAVASTGDALLTRPLTRHLPGNDKPETVTLVSLQRGWPTPVGQFICHDVPVKEGKALVESFWRDQDTGAWPETIIDAPGIDANHLAGFSWALRKDRLPAWLEGHVVVDGLPFEPQALIGLDHDPNGAGGGTLTQVRISGRIKIALPDRRLLPCGGMVTLTLTPDSAVLDLKGVDIPLADPETALRPVPRLHIETGNWPCTEATKPVASLQLDSGGKQFEIKVPMHRTHSLHFGPTDPMDKTETPGLWMHAFHVTLPRVNDTADTEPAEIQAEAELRGQIGLPGAQSKPVLLLNLITGKVFSNSSTFQLVDSSILLPLDSKHPFTGDSLALGWASGVTQNYPLFGGLAVTGTRGSVLAILAPPEAEGDSVLFYELRDWAQSVRLDLLGGANVQYDSMDDPDHARLSGSFELDNLFSWPVPDNISAEQATWPANPDQRISHHVTLRFDDTRFRVDTDLKELPLYLPAHAHHSLQRPGADPLEWDSYQSVALQPARPFIETREELLRTDLKPRKAPLSVRALDGRPKTDAARPHLMRSILSYPGGIGRVELAAETGLIIDASGHHWLGGDGARELHHTPLPVLAVLGDTREEGEAKKLAEIKALFAKRLNPLPAGTPTLLRANAEWRGTLPAPTPQQRAGLRDRLRAAWRSPDAASALIGPPAQPPRDNRALFQVTTRIAGEDPGSQLLQSADIGWTLSTVMQVVPAPETVLSLARHGRIDRQDIRPEFDILSPDLNVGHYQKAWQVLDQAQDALLLPGPVLADTASPPPPPDPTRVRTARLRLFAPHRRLGTLSEIATLPLTGGLSPVTADPATGSTPPSDAEREGALLARLDRWARRVLDGRAWQVPAGLVLYQEQGDGDFHSRARAIVTPSHPRGDRPVRQTRSAFAPDHAQPQMRPGLEMAQAQPALITGFTVGGQHPATLLSDDMNLPDSGQTEIRLTASGSTREWVLSGSGTRQAAQDPWIVDHESVPFRRLGGEGSRPSHTLPPANRAALSDNLAPAASAAPVPVEAEAPDDDLSWFIVPARQTQTTISGRSGGWSVARTGIEQLTGNRRLHLSAQLPNWAIHPRPVELGVNDRTRASSHEARSFDLSTRQSVLLHGKATPRDVLQATGDGGLDRRPRSARAGLVTLTYPADGIAPPDWTGRLTLSLSLLGDAWTPFAWTVQNAVLEIGNALYLSYPILKAEEPPVFDPGTTLELRNFVRDGAEGGTTAQDALLGARPGTPAMLRVLLKDTAGTLSRLVQFRLFGPGAGLAMPDRPLFLRFDDPAYNDQLTDQPKLKRESLSEGPNITDGTGSLVMVADRNQVTSGDFLEMGIGLQPASAQDDPPVFNANVTFAVSFERRRPGTPESLELRLKGSDKPRIPVTAKKSENFAAFSQLLSLLEPADGSDGPALLPDDRLRVTLFESEAPGATPWVTLDFDVVETPNLPGNSALYQKLLFKPDAKAPTLSAPLCPGRSTPTHVEAVDPSEMISGVLRRRAMFYWQDFEPAPGGQFEGSYAVLKRNLAGAAWLPADLATEWQKPGTDTPGPGEGPVDDTAD